MATPRESTDSGASALLEPLADPSLTLALTGASITLDESSGLQNAATTAVAGDSDDNDIAQSALPAAFAARLTELAAGTSINAALSGYDGSNTGSNMFTVSGTGTISDLSFAANSAGDPLNGQDSGLKTTDGTAIYLYSDTEDNNIVLGKTAGGEIVFALYLEETGEPDISGGRVWSILYDSLQHNLDGASPDDSLDLTDKLFVLAEQAQEFSLANAPSGQNLFLMFGNANAAIVVTGREPANQSEGANITSGDTVNTSQGGGTTTIGTNNQMIDPAPRDKQGNPTDDGEGMVFTFVRGANTDYTVPNLDQNEADVEANIQFASLIDANSASFRISQLQPQKAASVTLAAYSTGYEPGTAYVDGLLTDDTPVPITRVKVYDAAGNALVDTETDFTSAPLKLAIDFDAASGTVSIEGVKAGYTLEYETSATHNRVLIENSGSSNANFNASFDIGGFTLLEATEATAEIGSQVHFEDDGPTVELTLTAVTPPPLTTQDADTIGEASDTATGDFSVLFDFSSETGADEEGAVVAPLSYSLSVDVAATGLTSDGLAITVAMDGADILGTTNGGTTEIFRISVDPSGEVTLTQYAEIDHLPEDADEINDNDNVGLAPGNVVLTAAASITDGDNDSASDSESIDISAAFSFDDDTPTIDVAPSGGTMPSLTTQDAETIGADFDTASGSFAALFSLTSDMGADDDGIEPQLAYSLSVNAAATELTSDGQPITVAKVGADIVGSTSAGEVFRISVDTDGLVTLTQYAEIDHLPEDLDESNDNHNIGLAPGNVVLTAAASITDGDNDGASDSESIDISGAFSFDDDTPTIIARSNLVYSNASNPSPGGTGIFDYAIGADGRTDAEYATESDFSPITLTGEVGTSTISNATVELVPGSESTASASFSFSFDYHPNPALDDTTTATGTLTFDKVAGTYNVQLDAPLEGFTVLTTGQALGFTGYETAPGLETQIDKTQPFASVAQLADDFYVQFTGKAEPGGGTGANNLVAVSGNNLAEAGGTAFVNGELFQQAATWVSVSNLANGVAGDTLQKGEVLDMDFFTDNPFGFTGAEPTASASGIFLKMDGIGSEDLVIVLKLVDANDPSIKTTKAIIVDNADILKSGAAIPEGYHITLDNNDGAVIIESNDFNTAGENYLIQGAQLLVSTEGITGTAINLNGATGEGGASTTTQTFGPSTTDNDVIKVSDIGFVTASSATLDANLNFSFRVVDDDNDATPVQTLNVSIIGSQAYDGKLGLADVFDFNLIADSPAGADMGSISNFEPGVDKIDLSDLGGLTYVGTDPVTPGTGEAWYDSATESLMADVSGVGADGGVADFQVALTPAPGADDILV